MGMAEPLDALRRGYPAAGIEPNDNHWDVLHRCGDSMAALLHSILFVPDFVEVDGSVLLDWGPADRVDKFRTAVREGSRPLTDIESSFNWLEVPYLIGPSGRGRTTDREDTVLAEIIAEAWRGRLAHLFPGRHFVVR